MYSFHLAAWNTENNSQDTTCLCRFLASTVSPCEVHMVTRQSPDLPQGLASHWWRESWGQLDLCLMPGPLPLLVRVCAEESPSSFDVCSTQLLHLPLKFVPWSAGTRWPGWVFPDNCALSDPQVGRLSLGTYTAAWMAGSPHRKRERANLTVAYILSWERNHVWGTVETVGFPWRKPQSPSPWEESMGMGPWSWASLSLATPFPC